MQTVYEKERRCYAYQYVIHEVETTTTTCTTIEGRRNEEE